MVNNNQPRSETPSPASTERSQDSSPYNQSPEHLPLFSTRKIRCVGDSYLPSQTQSEDHHLNREYTGQSLNNHHDYDYDEGFYDDDDDDDDYDFESVDEDENEHGQHPPTTTHPFARFGNHFLTRSATNLPVLQRSDAVDFRQLLLLTHTHPSHEDCISDTASIHSNASTSSWTTVSDASTTPYKDMEITRDDDTNDDFFFYSDQRFVDSGWGGECLRETEDIDFDFVYALHTFVATVEGQANATKGDTMVLLDDSNSYWWLVRIVKDSSIGVSHLYPSTPR